MTTQEELQQAMANQLASAAVAITHNLMAQASVSVEWLMSEAALGAVRLVGASTNATGDPEFMKRDMTAAGILAALRHDPELRRKVLAELNEKP